MDKVPDDVLIQVFYEHLRPKSVTPASITPVCRRWYNVATTTPSLWFRVNLHLTSTHTVPALLSRSSSSIGTSPTTNVLSPNGLELYLSRSETDGAKVPLDITIKWDSSKNPVSDHSKYCDRIWFERIRCIKPPCGYEVQCREQMKNLFMLLAGIPALPITQCPERLKRWRTLTLDFDSQMKTMCMEMSFEPFNNSLCQASNLTSLTFEGVAGCEPGFHINFAPKLDFISLTDSAGMGLPDLSNLKNLEVMTTPFRISRGRAWIDVPSVENLSVSLPTDDITTGFFPSLKALQIYRSINDPLLACLESGPAQFKGQEGFAAEPNRLEFLTMTDISPHSLSRMSDGAYLTNAQTVLLFMSPITPWNRASIFGGFSREKYGKALATFIWHCAEDTVILGATPLARDLLEEARRPNEDEQGD